MRFLIILITFSLLLSGYIPAAYASLDIGCLSNIEPSVKAELQLASDSKAVCDDSGSKAGCVDCSHCSYCCVFPALTIPTYFITPPHSVALLNNPLSNDSYNDVGLPSLLRPPRLLI